MSKIFEFDMIGSDPEYFIVADEKAVSSIGLIQGEKECPNNIGNGYAILKDNVLVEGNIPPVRTRAGFIGAMEELKASIGKMLKNGLHIREEDSMTFSEEDLEHPQANVFGCSSYNNAWNPGTPIRAAKLMNVDKRCAGCHIHISYDILDKNYNSDMINVALMKAFEIFITYPARQVFDDAFRAEHYGAYGCYRDTPYGMEARSLGSHFSKEENLGWIYDGVRGAINLLQDKDIFAYIHELSLNELMNNTKAVYSKLGLDLESLKPVN